MNKKPGCFRINYGQKSNTTVYLFHIQKGYGYFSSWTTECGLHLQKRTHCRVQQGIVFALDLPLLHSFHSAAVQHLTHKGSDTSGHKNLFMKPRVLGLDSQSFIRQITPRRSLQSSEVHNKIPTTITASFSFFLSEDQQLMCLTKRIWQMWFLLWQMVTLPGLLHLRTPDNIPGKWRWPLDRKKKSAQSLNYLTKTGHEWI